MKINRIRISNILGIEALEFSPEGFTAITGPNGAGKSSILEAIKSATGSGHDATLLRKGAEKGEVVLVLDDGTEIQQRVTETGTTRAVVRDGKRVNRPADVIKALTDALAVNPVEFLTAPKKDRVKVLLETMPLNLDVKHLEKISRIKITATTLPPLDLIDHVRKQVYDDRTGTNRAVKEKESTINQLRGAMPDAPGGIEGDEDQLRARLEEVKAARDAETVRIDQKLGGLRNSMAEKIQKLKDDGQAEIEAIRERVRAAVESEQAAFAVIEGKAGQQRQKAADTYATAAEPLRVAIADIVNNRDAAAKRKATLETIEQMITDLEELRGDAEGQTQALEAIDGYKSELLNSLPIPGLEVRDGEVFRDGVPFDRLNTAQRVSIAFEIAKLRAGDLRLACLDGMELLDPESLAELRKQAKDSDIQVFITRVQGDEFAVKTE